MVHSIKKKKKTQSEALFRPAFNSVYKCPAAKLQFLTVRSWIPVHLQTFSGLWYEPQVKINGGNFFFFVEYLNF